MGRAHVCLEREGVNGLPGGKSILYLHSKDDNLSPCKLGSLHSRSMSQISNELSELFCQKFIDIDLYLKVMHMIKIVIDRGEESCRPRCACNLEVLVTVRQRERRRLTWLLGTLVSLLSFLSSGSNPNCSGYFVEEPCPEHKNSQVVNQLGLESQTTALKPGVRKPILQQLPAD